MVKNTTERQREQIGYTITAEEIGETDRPHARNDIVRTIAQFRIENADPSHHIVERILDTTLCSDNLEGLPETSAVAAEAAAAGPRSKAAQDRQLLAAQQEVAEEQASLKERELDTEVRKPADAQRYAVEQEAEGRKSAAIRDAEARRESTIAAATAKAEEDRLIGAGERQRREELAKAREIEGRAEGEAEKGRREELAGAVRVEGDAEAAAIRATGEAEADAMEKKAQAYEQYGDAAIVDLLAKALPEVVGRAAEPMSNIDKLTVISTDGASQLTKSVSNNVTQGLQLATDLTGVDLAALFSQLANRATGSDGSNGSRTAVGAGAASPPPPPPAPVDDDA